MQTCEVCGSLNPNKIQICEICGEEISSNFIIRYSEYDDLVDRLRKEDEGRNKVIDIMSDHLKESKFYYDRSEFIRNKSSYNKLVMENFSNFVDGSYLKTSKITILLIILAIFWFLYYCFKY